MRPSGRLTSECPARMLSQCAASDARSHAPAGGRKGRKVDACALAHTRKLDADLGSGTSKAATASVGSVGGKRFGCARDATCHSIFRRYEPATRRGNARRQAREKGRAAFCKVTAKGAQIRVGA
jgi:hypothetical protein